jgi:hypothetical protein
MRGENMADNNETIQDEELDDEIIELIDEFGKVIKFKLLDVTEYKGEKYTLLLAAEPNDEISDDEVVIFRLNEKEETLDPIEDDNLLQEIFDYYQSEEYEDGDVN